MLVKIIRSPKIHKNIYLKGMIKQEREACFHDPNILTTHPTSEARALPKVMRKCVCACACVPQGFAAPGISYLPWLTVGRRRRSRPTRSTGINFLNSEILKSASGGRATIGAGRLIRGATRAVKDYSASRPAFLLDSPCRSPEGTYKP